MAAIKSEHELQIDCKNMLDRILLPEVCWTAIDHGHTFDMRPGRRGVPIGLLEAQKRKARGIKAGLPDLMFWHVGQGYAIELKTDCGDLSEAQEIFLREMIAAGVEVAVCWNQTQVFNKVVGWGLTRAAYSCPLDVPRLEPEAAHAV